MVDQFHVADVDLVTSEDRGNRYHHGELGWVAPEVVGHRHDGPITIPDEDDLGRLVEKLGVGLGDVEAAKCRSGLGGRGDDGDDDDDRGETDV